MDKEYTLRTSANGTEEIYDQKFDSYEEAYDRMCLIYENEKIKGIDHKRWKIWKTSYSTWNGRINSMTQPA